MPEPAIPDLGRFSLAALIPLILLIGPTDRALAQQRPEPMAPAEIRALVERYRDDPRGPFASIRWFCTDGTTVPARERCPQPGGIQHAQHRDDAVALARRNGVYLAQILAGTDFGAFLDRDNAFSRAKQYQLGRFLFAADDGWILRRAQYYRGAFQAEDEEEWGRRFLLWLLPRDSLAATNFFLLRETTRAVPHGQADDLMLQIRADSKSISDAYPAFMDGRVKIHGQPDDTDIEMVRTFAARHRGRMPEDVQTKVDDLIRLLQRFYSYDARAELTKLLQRLPSDFELTASLRSYLTQSPRSTADWRVAELAGLLVLTRETLIATERPARRLVTMDLSLELERALVSVAPGWKPTTAGEYARKALALTEALAGTGHIELTEWDALRPRLLPDRLASDGELTADEYESVVENVRRAVDWSVGMVVANYEAEVNRYVGFEPLAAGFIDDLVRSSPLLPLGEISGALSAHHAQKIGRVASVSVGAASGGVRGLNAGIARGQLVVNLGDAEDTDFESDKVYALSRAPADLKPVAGILTVTEGSTVSHVQLLARNLGIPNAAILPETLRDLSQANGSDVFFAVSPGGGVRLKPASEMMAAERDLVEQRERSAERIRVSTSRMDLEYQELALLNDLRAGDSGRVCGPKAANLGQLSSLFPERVAPGFIIPFGVFRRHMEQPMPGQPGSYWEFVTATFAAADAQKQSGVSEESVDEYVLERLGVLRTAIESMPLRPDFVDSLRSRFGEAFGSSLGSVAVFIRSDTNMEDLKDFTGAGLNLTVPNVYSEADVLAGIRRVWASPYRERGYRWRQKYLLNPEDVYPSLLVLKSVNVDKSGVLITTGIESGDPADVTVAFNRGVGGAVDGQAAESYLLRANGDDVLLSPAREPAYTALPPRGGTRSVQTGFNRLILTDDELGQLRDIAERMRDILPSQPGIETSGPFDVELGFLGGRMWLFQVRPFVENRLAGATNYLMEMDARSTRSGVSLSEPLRTP